MTGRGTCTEAPDALRLRCSVTPAADSTEKHLSFHTLAARELAGDTIRILAVMDLRRLPTYRVGRT